MDSSSTAESRISRHHCALKPALAGSSRRLETAAMAAARGLAASAPAAAEEPEPVPDVQPGFKPKDADPARMALKRKADEGYLLPIDKKAKMEDASASKKEEYPRKWPDFEWERPGGGPKVTYKLNFPRVRIFAECTEDSDDELYRPINRRAPPDTEIERMVEEFHVAIKHWVYFYQ